jgi:cyclase
LLILDIGATAEGRGPDLDMVRALSEACFIPITVGGGVKSLADIDALLRAGADKVAIGEACFSRPGLLEQAAARFGNQAIVAIINYPRVYLLVRDLVELTDMHISTAAELAHYFKTCGAGEILLQTMERDGTMQGYDLDLIEAVSNAVDIPVIASGGCSGYADMAEAINRGASGVAAGALFAFTDCTPRGAAEYLNRCGIPARMP